MIAGILILSLINSSRIGVSCLAVVVVPVPEKHGSTIRRPYSVTNFVTNSLFVQLVPQRQNHDVLRRRQHQGCGRLPQLMAMTYGQPMENKKSPPIPVSSKRFVRSFWRIVSSPFPALRRMSTTAPNSNDAHETHGYHRMTIGLTLREGIFALATYMLVGVIAYSFVLETWPISDALYFSCVCFSTVGYGDICPTNAASKLFTCIFGLVGILFLGAAVATIGGQVVQAEVQAVQKAQHESQKRLMQLFDGMPKVIDRIRHQKHNHHAKDHPHHNDNEHEKEIPTTSQQAVVWRSFNQWTRQILNRTSKIRKGLGSFLGKVIPPISIVLGGSLMMQRLNGNTWSLLDSIYFALVSASTIGFGDYAPKTRAARLFAIVFIPLSVAAAGELLSNAALYFVEQRQRKVYKEQLEQDITIEHLQAMDYDGDGCITREEYILFMLMEMGRVSVQEREELCHQFDRLDITGNGLVDKDDLKLMAELRGARVIQS